ncbi:MAG: peptidase M22 [Syntrophomonadaceae bacterium]|nr:peptidase M22 [Syntrophomonadaceae bacterium]
MTCFLGIDSSAYTTSLAIVDENYNIIADERIPLQVAQGNRGLRQSEALFLHVKNLPFLFANIKAHLKSEIAALAVSAFPRRAEDSYMPVFLAGVSQAQVLNAFSRLPLHKISHQEGHIMAGLKESQELMQKGEFLAVHFSGGTSELLKIKWNTDGFMQIKTRIKGADLHAGQLVDRVGVAMGLNFPAGLQIEELAKQSQQCNIPFIPAAVKDHSFSFSGPENYALQLIKQGICREDIAFATLRVIAKTLEKIILQETKKSDIRDILLVGGVMANSLIKKRLQERLEHPAVGLKLYFASPELSTDNAVGVAMAAAYLNGKHGC